MLIITDVMGRDILLAPKQWKHIMKRHPYMERYVEEMILTLKKPDKLERKLYLKGYYYKHFKYLKSPNRFVLVIAKYLNGKGFIITAYLTDKIR